MNPEDAESLGVLDGDEVRVTSVRGSITVGVRVTERVMKGTVFMTFHFAESPANSLTSPVRDPVSGMPGLKATPVNIKPCK